MTDKPKPAKKIRASKPKRDDLDTPAGKPRRVTTDATKPKLPAPQDAPSFSFVPAHDIEDLGNGRTRTYIGLNRRRAPLTLRSVTRDLLLRLAYRLIKLAQRIGPLLALALITACTDPAGLVDTPQDIDGILTKSAPTKRPQPVTPNLACHYTLIPQPIVINGVTYTEYVGVVVCP